MSERTLRIALIQFNRCHSGVTESQTTALQALDSIEDIDIVCFPEVWMGAVILEEEDTRVILEEFSSAAKQKQFMVLTGGLLVKHNDAIYDVCHIIDKTKDSSENNGSFSLQEQSVSDFSSLEVKVLCICTAL